MLQPRIGDKVLVELEVLSVYSSSFQYQSGKSFCFMPNSYIKKILPREPVVGDKVRWVAREHCYEPCPSHSPYTLIHIHHLDERKFAVVAFQGDIPRSVWFEDLRLEPSCAD